jgi:hypothetical protein
MCEDNKIYVTVDFNTFILPFEGSSALLIIPVEYSMDDYL